MILDGLRKIAPTVAVEGNIDKHELGLPPAALIEAGPSIVYVLHDVKRLDIEPHTLGIQIVIAGHSHKPSKTERAGVLYINPGSAGPKRFRLPVSLARLDRVDSRWVVSFIDLKAPQL